jgi:hypothetical protein
VFTVRSRKCKALFHHQIIKNINHQNQIFSFIQKPEASVMGSWAWSWVMGLVIGRRLTGKTDGIDNVLSPVLRHVAPFKTEVEKTKK